MSVAKPSSIAHGQDLWFDRWPRYSRCWRQVPCMQRWVVDMPPVSPSCIIVASVSSLHFLLRSPLKLLHHGCGIVDLHGRRHKWGEGVISKLSPQVLISPQESVLSSSTSRDPGGGRGLRRFMDHHNPAAGRTSFVSNSMVRRWRLLLPFSCSRARRATDLPRFWIERLVAEHLGFTIAWLYDVPAANPSSLRLLSLTRRLQAPATSARTGA